jgi:3-dehydroquinate synthase
MLRNSLLIKITRSSSQYPIAVGSDLIRNIGDWTKELGLAKKKGKVAVISNATVFGFYGDTVERSLKQAGFTVSNYLIGDGERHKDLRTFENTLKYLSAQRLSRTDSVLALGGGVVGDLAGFAASVYLRGVPLIQVPTTLLSMIDSSVGGKTGINSPFGKNLIGTFHQPNGVMIDIDVLRTLHPREVTAGLCEGVKQAVLSGGRLFDRTAKFLEAFDNKAFSTQLESEGFQSQMSRLIADQISFKARIVRDDERESVENNGPRSRKILNFGHTIAHALEKVTNYRRLKHGEAVGHGILFAAELSKKLELIDADGVNLLYDVWHRVGPLPPIRDVDPQEVLQAVKYDKKVVNTSLNWVLLRGIGSPVIIPDTAIPRSAITQALKKITQK